MSTPGPSSQQQGGNPTKEKGKNTWTPSAILNGRAVLPDRYTTAEQLSQGLIGREVDPGRMSIYLCLLDDKPYLHPSLAALHKHRSTVHGIPMPASLTDSPITSGLRPMSATNPGATKGEFPDISIDKDGNEEWMTWKFTEEEEIRRKAYLPLA